MCGPVGVLDTRDDPVAASELRAMCARGMHCGPDDPGNYAGENVGPGHTPLSIIDLTRAGHQPFVHAGLALAFDGEIYNDRLGPGSRQGDGVNFVVLLDVPTPSATGLESQ